MAGWRWWWWHVAAIVKSLGNFCNEKFLGTSRLIRHRLAYADRNVKYCFYVSIRNWSSYFLIALLFVFFFYNMPLYAFCAICCAVLRELLYLSSWILVLICEATLFNIIIIIKNLFFSMCLDSRKLHTRCTVTLSRYTWHIRRYMYI